MGPNYELIISFESNTEMQHGRVFTIYMNVVIH